MDVARAQRAAVQGALTAAKEWEACRHRCCALLGSVVSRHQQIAVLSNRLAQGVLAHIPDLPATLQSALYHDIDHAMTIMLGTLRDFERLLRDLRRAYLDGRSLYELNWERFKKADTAGLPLEADFLEFLQQYYRAHALQYMEWEEGFDRLSKATTPADMLTLLKGAQGAGGGNPQPAVAYFQPRFTEGLPPPPVDGITA